MTAKETNARVGIFIKDIPLSVYKQFKIPCQERCGDTYWVRLKELLDKEERLSKIEANEND